MKLTVRDDQVLVVRPGDRVLIAMDAELDDFDVIALRTQLGERFPGVEFTFLAPVISVVVERDEAPE